MPETSPPSSTPEPGRGALAGLKIVDLTRVLGGPYATQILGDHGAEIIKIEPPQGDEVRAWGPPFHEGVASYFIGVNRNKRSLSADLSRPEGRELLFRLLEEADILVENFKAGTLEKWGMGFEEVLKARFPRLIHCRISGFGSDGPRGGLPGYDAIAQCMSGMFSVNGTPESGPTRIGVPVVDMTTGLYAVTGILIAVIERQRSGLGQFVEVPLYDSALSFMHPHAPNYFLSGKLPKLTGNAHPNISPYDTYATGTVPVFLAIGNDGAFRKLCQVLGKPELASDPRYRTNGDRLVNRAALKVDLEALLAPHDGDALSTEFLAAGLPAGAIRTLDAALSDPQAVYRGTVIEKEWYKGINTPLRFSRSEAALRHLPPKLGENGKAILHEAGLSETDIEALEKNGIVNLSGKPAS